MADRDKRVEQAGDWWSEHDAAIFAIVYRVNANKLSLPEALREARDLGKNVGEAEAYRKAAQVADEFTEMSVGGGLPADVRQELRTELERLAQEAEERNG